MAEYAWPKMSERTLIGKRISRLDGPQKSGGRAKYGSDANPERLLYAAILTSPHSHAKLKSMDFTAAKASPGVTAVVAVTEPGAEVQWEGAILAAVAAETELQARDAIRKIKVDWEILPHLVKDDDVAAAGPSAKPAGEQVQGDPDEAKKSAAFTSSGFYGLPVLTHCCLEPHGQVVQWAGDQITAWPSTQSVSNYAGDLGAQLSVPATAIKVDMDHIGGGFGSKFQSDQWAPSVRSCRKNLADVPLSYSWIATSS